jgi:hypothetical protein
MSAKHHLHTAAAIPHHISPSLIISALHDHTTALTLQALTQSHSKLPSPDPHTLKDTYWYPTDLNPLTSYSVIEAITFLPGIGEWGKHYLTFPTCFQDTPMGIRTRADASGVVLRAEFRVVRGGAGAEVEGEGGGVGDAEWVLVEDAEVSCAWWMMPFVKGKMEVAHRGICDKVVEKVVLERRHGLVAGAVAQVGGRAKASEDQIPSISPFQVGDAVEVDALESQRMELPAHVPEKITYH